MPAWRGGPCPECGEDMPPNLVRCATCRALLNDDLQLREISVPEFAPLEEIDSVIEATPRGFYADCPHCHKELRINCKYVGQNVACRFCNSQFQFRVEPPTRVTAFYFNCPHCSQELRAAAKYLGAKVACKHCNGSIHLV